MFAFTEPFTEVTSGTPWKDAVVGPPDNQQSTGKANRFQPLSPTDPADSLVFLNEFAHHVNHGKKTQQQRKAPTISPLVVESSPPLLTPKERTAVKSMLIQSLADLDTDETRALIHALPKCRHALAKLALLCPVDAEVLQPGERWVMADTGSTLHGIDVAKECPEYKPHVRPTRGKKAGAETAGGGTISIDGDVDVTGIIDGEEYTIPFKDMKVSMPIASMRRTVKAGNDMFITEGGGAITNRKTKSQIRLHERLGVYFFKMKILPPKPGKVDQKVNRSTGFSGRA